VPQTATTRILSLKYRLIADVYLAQNKQDKYLQTKAEYKALLASRAATDPLAKTALDAIDKTYPENMAPTVTYPEGQEQP
jgi:hypothetical protein